MPIGLNNNWEFSEVHNAKIDMLSPCMLRAEAEDPCMLRAEAEDPLTPCMLRAEAEDPCMLRAEAEDPLTPQDMDMSIVRPGACGLRLYS